MTEKRISLDKLLSTDAAWKIIETAKNEEIKKLKVQQRDQVTLARGALGLHLSSGASAGHKTSGRTGAISGVLHRP